MDRTDRAEVVRRLRERLPSWGYNGGVFMTASARFRFPPADAKPSEALAFVGHLAEEVEPWGWALHSILLPDHVIFVNRERPSEFANRTATDLSLAAAFAVLEIPE